MPRSRLAGVSPLARASKRSKPDDVAKIFKEVDSDGDGKLSLEELRVYLGEYLGYGEAEISGFYKTYAGESGGVDLAGFQSGFAGLNPYTISKLKGELVVRKPGAVCAEGAQLQLEELEDCSVLICDRTEQAFVDECKNCRVLIGPCDSSTFIRDCKDCTFWVATRQLRTRDCHSCTFFLYTFTEPIIESSHDLAFAPFAASYPGLTTHFEEAKFAPTKNYWSALFDFTGNNDGANWRILPLAQCQELVVHIPSEGEPAWDCPTPKITHDLLCSAPPRSDESSGQSVSNIPQTRPHHPSMPPPGTMPQRLVTSDMEGAIFRPAFHIEQSKAAMPIADGKAPPKLRKPKWIAIKKIKPDSSGVNIFAKIVKASPVDGKEALSEVVIGDSTALITLCARGEQVAVCQPGMIVRIQNARATVFKSHIHLLVDKWGVLKHAPADHCDIEVNNSNDISAVEYELA